MFDKIARQVSFLLSVLFSFLARYPFFFSALRLRVPVTFRIDTKSPPLFRQRELIFPVSPLRKKGLHFLFPSPPLLPPQPSLETSAADNRRRKGRGETLHWRHTLLNGGRGESSEDAGERDSQWRSTVLFSFFRQGLFWKGWLWKGPPQTSCGVETVDKEV